MPRRFNLVPNGKALVRFHEITGEQYEIEDCDVVSFLPGQPGYETAMYEEEIIQGPTFEHIIQSDSADGEWPRE